MFVRHPSSYKAIANAAAGEDAVDTAAGADAVRLQFPVPGFPAQLGLPPPPARVATLILARELNLSHPN